MTSLHNLSTEAQIEVLPVDSLMPAIKAGLALCAFFLSVMFVLG